MAGLFVDAALESAVESQGRSFMAAAPPGSDLADRRPSLSCPRARNAWRPFNGWPRKSGTPRGRLGHAGRAIRWPIDAELMERPPGAGGGLCGPRRPGGRARNAPGARNSHERSGPACGRCSTRQASTPRCPHRLLDAPEGGLLASRLGRMAQALSAGEGSAVPTAPAAIETYCETRCDAAAAACGSPLLHLAHPAVHQPTGSSALLAHAEPGEVGFDMPHGEFTHRGHLCTFETMVSAFGLEDLSLQPMGEIIHEIDLRWSLRAPGDRGHRCRPQGLAPSEALRS